MYNMYINIYTYIHIHINIYIFCYIHICIYCIIYFIAITKIAVMLGE